MIRDLDEHVLSFLVARCMGYQKNLSSDEAWERFIRMCRRDSYDRRTPWIHWDIGGAVIAKKGISIRKDGETWIATFGASCGRSRNPLRAAMLALLRQEKPTVPQVIMASKAMRERMSAP